MSLIVVARYVFKRDVTAEDLYTLRELAAASREEPGNLGYEVLPPDGESRHVVLIERYRNETALEAHRASPHFEELAVSQIFSRLETRTVETAYAEAR